MAREPHRRDSILELLRRVDEVRGLASLPPLAPATRADDSDLLIHTATELADELEKSQRRLIETNVQLVSLREVASSVVSALDDGEATRAVAGYLLRAFGLNDVFLCLANLEDAVLEGTWCHGEARGAAAHPLRVPLTADGGEVAAAIWENRTCAVATPRRRPPLALRGDHPLARIMEGLSSYAVVPLQRSRRPGVGAESEAPCAAACPFAAGSGDDRDGGAEPRQARRPPAPRRCLECARFPILGVVGFARSGSAAALDRGEVTLLESVALSVAPVLENARLYHDLRRSERFRDHILNSMGAGLLAVGLDGRLLAVNRAAEEITGHLAAYVAGEPLAVVFTGDAHRRVAETLNTGREWVGLETHVTRPDGTRVPVALTTSLLRDERREVYGAIAVFSDLTRLRRMEEQIRQLDRLAALGRFTTSVAHEIRNPLAGIAAGVQYLRKSFGDDARELEHVEFIQHEIERLDRIVGDLFTVTHPKQLQPRPADLAEVLERSLHSLRAALADRHVRVAWTLPHGPTAARFDPDQIQQVCINLVKNAVEASPEGGALRLRLWTGTAESEALPGATAGGFLCLAVEDDGPGIPPAERDRIFEPFFTTKSGGTGLGLYVCHDIVERHGGHLRVRCEPGCGACFVMALPLEAAQGGSND